MHFSTLPVLAAVFAGTSVLAVDNAVVLQLFDDPDCSGPPKQNVGQNGNGVVAWTLLEHRYIKKMAGTETTFADIAAKSGVHEPAARQIVRHDVSQDIFSEPRPGVIAHNAVSRLLAEDPEVHDWVSVITDEMWPAAVQESNALAKWRGSEEPNETGFALAHQTDKSMYEFLSGHPERARRFGNAMRSHADKTGLELHHVVDGYPWGKLDNGVVVDVGGSKGFVSFALARRFPSLSFVVQDLEPVIRDAEKGVPADVADRVEFMVHDFLTDQPVHHANVYLFRWIMHNWSDKYCIEILRSLIPALKPGAKIIVCDNVLPKPGELSKWHGSRLRAMDISMRKIQNPHEREIEDWVKLFDMAGPGFAFRGAEHPAGSDLWLLVFEWEGA